MLTTVNLGEESSNFIAFSFNFRFLKIQNRNWENKNKDVGIEDVFMPHLACIWKNAEVWSRSSLKMWSCLNPWVRSTVLTANPHWVSSIFIRHPQELTMGWWLPCSFLESGTLWWLFGAGFDRQEDIQALLGKTAKSESGKEDEGAERRDVRSQEATQGMCGKCGGGESGKG